MLRNKRTSALPGPPATMQIIRGARGGKGKRVGLCWSFLCGGGVETVNRDIAEHLSREDYIVDGIVLQALPQFLPMAQSFDDFIVLNEPFEPIGRPRVGPFTPVAQAASFQKLLQDRHYDVLVMACMWAPFWVAHMHGIPIVEIWHGFGCWNAFDLPSTEIVSVSDMTRRQIEVVRPQHASVTVIRNAVSAARYADTMSHRQEARVRFGLPADAPVVLYCGRFSPEKRWDDAIKAFVKAKERRPGLKLLMAGTIMPGYEDLVRNMGTGMGVAWDKDTFHVTLPHEEVHLAFAAADVMLHPSEWEGLGMVLLEALAAGLPIISTFAGGCGEVLDGVAVKVRTGDIGGMAAELVRVLGDPDLRADLAAKGRSKVAAEFTLEEQAAKMSVVLQRVIAAARAPWTTPQVLSHEAIARRLAMGEEVGEKQLHEAGLMTRKGKGRKRA
jgi:glycosyltransferase involved in cell wall biosynthesis